jgi:uncharacterized phage-associated protein
MANPGYCEICRQDVKYMVEERLSKARIKDEEVEYLEKRAFCCKCGSDVYVSGMDDENVKAACAIYRQRHGLIPLEDIKAMPVKYDIGIRPLSLVLGMGEQTFTRYCNGDIPSKMYSDFLRRVFNEPAYYLELLESKKGSIASGAFERSRQAVEKSMSLPGISFKLSNAIYYLLNQVDLTPLALQKALYYAQGFFNAFFGSFMFDEDCEAWAHGPVYRDVYNQFSDFRFDPIGGCVPQPKVSTKERVMLDSIVMNVCCYSGKALEGFTHFEEPWLAARGDLDDGAKSSKIITKESMGEYFIRAKEKFNMISPMNISEYMRSMENQASFRFIK